MRRHLSTLVALAAAGLLASLPACHGAPATSAPTSAASPPPGDAPAQVATAPATPAEPAETHAAAEDPGHHAEHHQAGHAPDAAHHGEQHDAEHRHPHADHSFEDAERYARMFDAPGRDRWQKPAEVVRLLALAPGQTVADLGAGTGYFLPHLAPAVQPGGRVVGLDREPNMVAHMQQRIARERIAGAEARVVADGDPGLAAGSVDRVLVVNTWHHLDRRVDYARKLLGALRPGGFVLVVDYTLESPRGPPPAGRLAPALVVDELTRAGFAVEVVEESLPDQYIVRGRKP
jgi:SAM-dependent methyltransferase